MSRRDELRAELELLDLEEAFIEAKADGTATQEMKDELRQKRREIREARASAIAVSPATITAKADVKEV